MEWTGTQYHHTDSSQQTRGLWYKSQASITWTSLTPPRRRYRAHWTHQHLRWTQNQWNTVLFVMNHDSAWTALAGAWNATVGVVNVTLMLVYSKETVLEVQVWWYGVPFHSTDVLKLSAFRGIWQDKDIAMRFWHLLRFHSLTPTETLRCASRATPGVIQHVCRWDIWMSNMLGYCHSLQIFPQSNICRMCLIVALDVVILKTFDQLEEILRQEWEAIPLHEIQYLIRSMRRRCTAVANANEWHTRYWTICDFWNDTYVISDVNSLNQFW